MKLIAFLPLLLFSGLLSAQRKTYLTIHFDSDKSVIRVVDKKILDSVVAMVSSKKTNNISIEITGHCDSQGRDTYNDTLSLKRAKAVSKYLLAGGVAPSLITQEKGYGETRPVTDECTIFHRQYNRRTELVITEDNNLSTENTISKIINDTATKKGTNIILKNLNFQGGLHRLLNSSLPILEDLLNAMQKNKNLVIRIEGHICCEVDARDGYDPETRTYNLSEERARTVYTYLVNNHISPQRLSIKGYGHQMPLFPFPEKTADQEIANRRVEIKIISK